ncbi:MAG: transcription elongation factor GreA [Bacillota bacterium]|nr:transcription elongation factor GreA [Bacillota bacterium]
MPQVTPEGLQQIQEELRRLKTVGRREVADALRAARQLGDLVNNEDYQQALAEHHRLERRIAELESFLQNAEVVTAQPEGAVGLGSRIEVRDLSTGELLRFRVVGASEGGPVEELISADSPVGRALIGCRPGEVAEARLPDGEIVRFEIVRIDGDKAGEGSA